MLPLTLIGPLLRSQRGDQPSGRPILFMTLLAELDRIGIRYRVIDSNQHNHLPFVGRPLSALQVLANAHHLSATRNISFHGAGPGIATIGGRLLRHVRTNQSRVSLHVFGGAFKRHYDVSNTYQKFRIERVLANAHAVFFETQSQVDFFKRLNPNTFWFPNSRPRVLTGDAPSRNYGRRFVFVGQVSPEKGVREIIALAERLGAGYAVDVFGPTNGGIPASEFEGKRAKYRGVLAPDQVAATIAGYDALLLPTSYAGEGFPGVVIEAMSVAVPSIASRHAGIPEIIVDGQCGFLVAPRSTDDLLSAVKRLERHDLAAIRQQCLDRFRLFDSTEQTKLFLKRIGVAM
jgi:glycosyltransferase involved in cell wall biosynthesis